MKRERRQPTKRELASATSRRPVVRRMRPQKAHSPVPMEHVPSGRGTAKKGEE